MSEVVARTSAVILAAGDGKRLRSDLPKVLHRAAGTPLILHLLATLLELELDEIIVVVSPRGGPVRDAIENALPDQNISFAVQEEPRGTADALEVGLGAVEAQEGAVLVLPGDTPLVQPATLSRLLMVHASTSSAATLLTAKVAEPRGYGRVIRDRSGDVEKIVEEPDATESEREVDEVNSSIYVFDTTQLRRMLEKVDRENAQGEYYLPDVVALMRKGDETVSAMTADPEEIAGVNDRKQLAEVSAALRRRACERWMAEGVTIVDPSTTYIDDSVTIGRDTVILPMTYLEGDTTIGAKAEVGPQVRLVDSQIGDGASVSFAVVRGSVVGHEASVGPYSSLRPGTKLERGARVGSFVETKNTTIGEGSKANHLAYLGDAMIGKRVNIGAGTITCNWDGERKHETVIEDDAYISSDTMIVAPSHIGKRAATGAGAVVKGDVPDDALAVGMPARIIEGKGNKMKKPE